MIKLKQLIEESITEANRYNQHINQQMYQLRRAELDKLKAGIKNKLPTMDVGRLEKPEDEFNNKQMNYPPAKAGGFPPKQ